MGSRHPVATAYRLANSLYDAPFRRTDSLRKVLKREIKWRMDNEGAATDPGPGQLVDLWRHGFSSAEAHLYGLDGADYDDYLSYAARKRTEQLDGRWDSLLYNKLQFYWLMDRYGYGEHLPDTFGLIKRGRFHPVGPTREADRGDGTPARPDGAGAVVPVSPSDPTEAVEALFRAHDRLVFKPVHGSTGTSVFLCTRRDGEVEVNGSVVPESVFYSKVAGFDDYLVTGYVEQADYAAGLYPDANNTVRVLTMSDGRADSPYIPVAVQRIGTDESAPVDNWSKGGISAAVDVETGELSPGIRSAPDGVLRRHATHPHSNTPIAGVEIPRWPAIRGRLREMAADISFMPYVGWDVLVTDEDGGFVLLEANCSPGVHSLQVHRPLLADPRARAFYEKHGIV
jgi:hypothetical protein